MQTHERSVFRWDDARVFLALHRMGSLKRAAAALGVNISTVSRKLDAIEAVVGTRLFDRTPEGTRPTAAAERLYGFAEAMEDAAHAFQRGVAGLEVLPVGVVRLAVPPGIADYFIMPALEEFMRQFPGIRLQIIASIGYSDLPRYEADIALRAKRPTVGDLMMTCLGKYPYIVVGAPKLVESTRLLKDPRRVSWITWGLELADRPDRDWVFRYAGEERITLETSSITTQVEAARAGLGFMLAPAPFARLTGLNVISVGDFVAQSLARLPPESLWLVGHQALRDVPRVSVVWTWVQSLLTATRDTRKGSPYEQS